MRIDPPPVAADPPPSHTTPEPPAAAAPAAHSTPAPHPKQTPPASPTPPPSTDRIAPHNPAASGPDALDALATWAKNEWSTVGSAAHGLASTPGIVSHAWTAAARTNAALSGRISETVDAWDHTAPSVRQTGIDALRSASEHVSRTGTAVARELSDANRSALSAERAGTLGGAAPTTADPLPAAVAGRARAAAGAFADAAAAQSAKAAAWLPGVSRVIGATAADVHAGLTHGRAEESILSRIPIINKSSLVSLAFVGGAIASDVAAGKSVADATVANVGGTIAGMAAGEAATAGLTGALGAATIADGLAAASGVAVASGPVGWAVAGGVLAGAAVGYGVYKAVESAPGQAVIDGAGRFARSLAGDAREVLHG